MDKEAIWTAMMTATFWGHRWGEDASQYEDVLRDAGYDRSDPAVQECDRELRDLHGAIQHAREILDILDDLSI